LTDEIPTVRDAVPDPRMDERSPTSMRPLLLVDVDGVLNALVGSPFGTRKQEIANAVFEVEFIAQDFPIRVPAGTRERIATLEDLFDCFWATSWEHRATSELAPGFGFGKDWPVIRFEDDFPPVGTWKLPAVRRFAELPENATRPLAWIDDDLQPDTLDWAARRTRAGTPTLMVRPDGDVGFTSRHFGRLLTFHADCRPREDFAPQA
jgi:hypothetical protein